MLFIARSNVAVQHFGAQPCRTDNELTAFALRSLLIEQPRRVSNSKIAGFRLPAQQALLIQAGIFAEIKVVRIFRKFIGVAATVVTAPQFWRSEHRTATSTKSATPLCF